MEVEYFETQPEDSRLVTLPIPANRLGLYKYWDDAKRCFWISSEISMTKDIEHFECRLNNKERHYISRVLAFFSVSDGLINVNMVSIKDRLPMLEAKYFCDFQIMMENEHALTYSLQVQALIKDAKEREWLLDSVKNIPTIAKMANFMSSCADPNIPLGEQLLRNACSEGLLLASGFVSIYRLSDKGLMPGLAHANELIARDEALHTMFALYVYTLLKPEHKLPRERVYDIFRAAVDIAKDFNEEALGGGLSGLNIESMGNYLECSADNMVTLIDLPPIYGSKNTLHFMERINLTNRTNFFERRVSEYSKPKVADVEDFQLAEDL